MILSVISLGSDNYHGINKIPVCTGSSIYRLHCICMTYKRIIVTYNYTDVFP